MKRIFWAVFSISQICFLLICPGEALEAAREGMNLWLKILVPTLLPFLIMTGILIRTDMTRVLLKPAERIWKCVSVFPQQVPMHLCSVCSAGIRLEQK